MRLFFTQNLVMEVPVKDNLIAESLYGFKTCMWENAFVASTSKGNLHWLRKSLDHK